MKLLRLKEIRYQITLPGRTMNDVCTPVEMCSLKAWSEAHNIHSYWDTLNHRINERIESLEYEIETEYDGIRYSIRCDATWDVNFSRATFNYPGHCEVDFTWGDVHMVVMTDDGEYGPEVSHFDPRYDDILNSVENDLIARKEQS